VDCVTSGGEGDSTPLGRATSAELPNELRTRTYDATIAPYPLPSSGYHVDVRGEFLSRFGFAIGVSGRTLSFEIDGPPFFERLPAFSYLMITGQGTTTVDTPPVSSITFPFSAVFEYCILKEPMGPRNNCFTTPEADVITYSVCASSNHQMVLKHR